MKTKFRRSSVAAVFVRLVLFMGICGCVSAQTFTLLKSFSAATNTAGFDPESSLVQDSSGVLYGETTSGGNGGSGTIFSIEPNGANFTVLKTFSAPIGAGTNADGSSPQGGLFLSGSTLYGTTFAGGASGYGTVFRINTDGSGFTNLHNFSAAMANPLTGVNTNSDGANPLAALALSRGFLYGAASQGGLNGAGSIFKISLDGTTFAVVLNFQAQSSNTVLAVNTNGTGANPSGELVVSGSVIYGTAENGGHYGAGTVFKVDTDGSAFADLHDFTGTNDGGAPAAGLALAGSTLFGTASQNGTGGFGTVFSLNISGGSFSNLYSFTGDGDGGTPLAGLVVNGATLYGVTQQGGASGIGEVFSLSTNGGSPSTIHNFGGNSFAFPQAGLLLSGGTLYGTTTGGGNYGEGQVFAVNTNGSFTNLYNFGNGSSQGANPQSLTLAGTTLYGAAAAAGAYGSGSIFKVNKDGSGFSPLHNFSAESFDSALGVYTNADGGYPQPGLLVAGGTVYGTTIGGGTGGYGTLFSVNTNGGGFTTLLNFATTNGAYPQGGLILSGTALYGTTQQGGASRGGVVYSVNTNGSGFQILYAFTGGADGGFPMSGLTLAGTTLYGSTEDGGSGAAGTIFRLNTSGGAVSNLYNFTGAADGGFPRGGLLFAGTKLYGTTANGGTYNDGTVFAVNTNGGLTTLASFNGTNGANPQSTMFLSNYRLYGSAANGGAKGNGALFEINTNGTGLTNIYNFSAALSGARNGDGINPGGILLSGAILYGAASQGGADGDGTLFAVALSSLLQIAVANGAAVLTWPEPVFALQTSTNVQSDYTTISNASSPFTNSLNAPQQFFHLTPL